MWLITVHLVATAVWLHIQFGLQGAKMLRLQGAMLAVERGLTFLGVLLLVFSQRMTLENTLWCYILPPLLLSIAGAFILRRFVELRGFVDPAQCRKILTYSLPLIPFAIVGYLSTSQLDAFFITRYLSTRDLGIYAVAAQINGMVLQLPIMANTVLLSMFVSLKSGGQESLLQRFFKEAVPSITLLWSAACVVLAVTSVYLLPLVFGGEFEKTSTVFWILTASSVAAFPILMGFATLSNAYSRTYISMYASIATALANVGFNLLLIPQFGVIGCAWATVLSAIANLTVFYILLRRSGLITRNWVYASVAPITLSALLIALGFSAAAAVSVFVLLVFFVAYFHWESVEYTVRVVKGRLNVKDVPPESSLR
jgi:O-antigen/teichoic acid export membrane protein